MTTPSQHSDAGTLDRFVVATLGDRLPEQPPGWPNEIEAALLDSIFSIRARYGSETNGVRAVVNRWRNHRDNRADDLGILSKTSPDELARIAMNSSRASGRLKAAIVVDAAAALVGVGLVHANQFDLSQQHKRAYLSVKGCGPVTWSYFGMLLGFPDVKADTWIVRYVSKALGRQTSSTEAQRIVNHVAQQREISATQLDHAIWQYARKTGLRG